MEDPSSLAADLGSSVQFLTDSNIIGSLQSQLEFLRCRVKELECENSMLSSKVVNCCCHCHQMNDNLNCTFTDKLGLAVNTRKSTCVRLLKTKKSVGKMSGFVKLICHHSWRYVALKIMYFGQRFHGFASDAQHEPTVESELFTALEKTKLLLGDKKIVQYSRCGRTDKGVSSIGQVIALFLPSSLKEAVPTIGNLENIISDKQYEPEIDYVKLLNRVLPKDIRVMGWSPAPMDFSARFDGYELWVMKVRGSAFLWHQVRCMVAVLFMIGQGFESPNVIDALLDVKRNSRKPQYIMAPEIPLILYSCEFPNLQFTCSSDAKKALKDHLESEWRNYEIQAAIFHEALLACVSIKEGESSSNNKRVKKDAIHVPLLSRPSEPSYEERRAKIDSRTRA